MNRDEKTLERLNDQLDKKTDWRDLLPYALAIFLIRQKPTTVGEAVNLIRKATGENQ